VSEVASKYPVRNRPEQTITNMNAQVFAYFETNNFSFSQFVAE
jgi:hypothetical protein